MPVTERARPRHDDVHLRRPWIAKGGPVVAPLVGEEHRILGAQDLGCRLDVLDEHDEVEIGGIEPGERGAAGQIHVSPRKKLTEPLLLLDHASAFINRTNASGGSASARVSVACPMVASP